MKKLLLTFYSTSPLIPFEVAAIAKALAATIINYDKHTIHIIINANNNTVQKALKQAAKYELTVFIKH